MSRKIEIIDGVTYVNGKRQGRAPKAPRVVPIAPAAPPIAERDVKPENMIACPVCGAPTRPTVPPSCASCGRGYPETFVEEVADGAAAIAREEIDNRELPPDEPSPNYAAADVRDAAAITAFIAEAEGPSSVTPEELRTLELHAPFELADCAELRDAIKSGHPEGTLVEVCIPTADTVRIETRAGGMTVQRTITLQPRTA